MDTLIKTKDFAPGFLQALGVDSKHVADVSVRMVPAEVVRVDISIILTREAWDRIKELCNA